MDNRTIGNGKSDKKKKRILRICLLVACTGAQSVSTFTIINFHILSRQQDFTYAAFFQAIYPKTQKKINKTCPIFKIGDMAYIPKHRKHYVAKKENEEEE